MVAARFQAGDGQHADQRSAHPDRYGALARRVSSRERPKIWKKSGDRP